MSEAAAAPAPSTGPAAPPAPAQRIVPGAPPPQPLTKSQIRKRKQKAVGAAKSKTGEEGGLLDIVESPKDAALVDHVPEAVAETLVAAREEEVVQPVVQDVTPAAAAAAGEKVASPIIDQVLNKRIKHFSKKLQRIHVYSSKPEETLNEDQKKSVQSIPALEAVVKELEETKKLIEAHETARAAEIAAERAAEAEQTEKRIREAVDYAEANHVTHTRSLVAFLALSTLLAAPIPIPVNGNSIGDHRVPSDENEKAVVVDAGRVLLTPEFGDSEKDDLIKGLLGLIHDGSFHGLTYSRLRAIVGQFIHPTTPIPSAPASPHLSATAATTTNGAPTAAESVPLNFTTGVSLSREPTPTPTPPVPSTSTTGTGFLGASASAPGSFQFLSASDLDLDLDPSNDITEQEPPVAPTSEWVHVDEDKPAPSFGVPPAEVVQESAVFSGDVERLVAEETADIRGQTLEIPISNSVPTEPISVTLDWADADAGDGDLPSIDSLEQSFGKSGAATPVSPFGNGIDTPPFGQQFQSSSAGVPSTESASAEPKTNGHHHHGRQQSRGGGGGPDDRDRTFHRGPHSRGGRGGPRQQQYGWGPAPSPTGEPDAEGFVSAPGRRGRGGPPGGEFRGGRGGEFRGGERGRGGGGGGEFRGGERGGRGGFRGGSGPGEFGGRGGGNGNGNGGGFRGGAGAGAGERGRGGFRGGGHRGGFSQDWNNAEGGAPSGNGEGSFRGRGGRGGGGRGGRGGGGYEGWGEDDRGRGRGGRGRGGPRGRGDDTPRGDATPVEAS